MQACVLRAVLVSLGVTGIHNVVCVALTLAVGFRAATSAHSAFNGTPLAMTLVDAGYDTLCVTLQCLAVSGVFI